MGILEWGLGEAYGRDSVWGEDYYKTIHIGCAEVERLENGASFIDVFYPYPPDQLPVEVVCDGSILQKNDLICLLQALPSSVRYLKFPAIFQRGNIPKEDFDETLTHIPPTLKEVGFGKSYFIGREESYRFTQLPATVTGVHMPLSSLFTKIKSVDYGKELIYRVGQMIATLPPGVRYLSLKNFGLGKYYRDFRLRENYLIEESLFVITDAIPDSVKELDLSDNPFFNFTKEVLCRFFSQLSVATIKLRSCDLKHFSLPERQEILASFTCKTLNLAEFKDFLDHPFDPGVGAGGYTEEDKKSIMSKLSSNVSHLGALMRLREFNLFAPMLENVTTFVVHAQKNRLQIHLNLPHIKHLRINTSTWDDSYLPNRKSRQYGESSQAIMLPESISRITLEHHFTYYNNGFQRNYSIYSASKKLLLAGWRDFFCHLPETVSEVGIKNPRLFFRLPKEHLRYIFEALPSSVKRLHLSHNAFGERVKKLQVILRAIPETVEYVNLDHNSLGTQLTTVQLIRFFSEIPKRFHLSLQYNDLFSCRPREEIDTLLSAIQALDTTGSAILKHNGESDANRALPALLSVIERGIFPQDIAEHVLSFLTSKSVYPREMIQRGQLKMAFFNQAKDEENEPRKCSKKCIVL